MNATFTLREVADELGVHYMTAYRYVRLGLLDADKVDNAWQVSADAVERFRTGTGAGPVEPGTSAPWAERLEARLAIGDGPGAWGVVESAMTSGADARSVYLDMLVPALVNIGARWAAGEIDIAVEHQASGIAMRIIGRLSPRFARRGRSQGDVVLGALSGETHGLVTAMLGDLMRMHGWDVIDLGADTPASSFLVAAQRVSDLRAVGISVTHTDHLGTLAECCADVKAAHPDVVLFVGGQAFESVEHARSFGADELAISADQMNEMLQSAPA